MDGEKQDATRVYSVFEMSRRLDQETGRRTSLANIAEELEVPMANVALAWVMSRPGLASAVAGARSPEQIARNVTAMEVTLSPEVISRLDVATDALKNKLGPNADYWNTMENARTR